MRALFLALLLFNLVFFAWSQGWMAGAGLEPMTQREPQRLALQIHPEQVRVTPLLATAATPASSPTAEPATPASAPSAPETSPSSPTPAPPQSAASAEAVSTANAAPTVCRQIGPYGAMETDVLTKAQTALASAGLKANALKFAVPEQWMVLLGPFPSEDAMRTALDQIKQGGKVKVFAPVTDRPRYQPGISLGVFGNESSAQEQLQIVQKHGVQGAKVVQRNAGMHRTVLRLPALSPSQLATLEGLSGKLGAQIIKTCAP